MTLDDIREAQVRLRGIAVRTPLLECHLHQADGQRDDRRLYLKLENLQPIGSFKIRGAANVTARTPREKLERGLLTA